MVGDHPPVPTFSVVIAAYNAADTIAAAVRSALDQSPPPLEVVVVDDGSSVPVAEALGELRERVTVVRRARGGFAAAMSDAICTAAGDFAVFLGADDAFRPGRLRALAGLADARPELDLLTTDATVTIGDREIGRFYSGETRFAEDDQRVAILRANFVFGHVAVRRARAIDAGLLDTSMESASDWDLFIRLILDGARAGLVPEPLSVYRLRPGSITSQRTRLLGGRIVALRKALARDDLDARERAVAQETLREQELELALEEARAGLRSGAPDARRRAWAVARDGRQQPVSRARALLTLVAPPVAAAALRRKEARVALDPAALRGRRQ